MNQNYRCASIDLIPIFRETKYWRGIIGFRGDLYNFKYEKYFIFRMKIMVATKRGFSERSNFIHTTDENQRRKYGGGGTWVLYPSTNFFWVKRTNVFSSPKLKLRLGRELILTRTIIITNLRLESITIVYKKAKPENCDRFLDCERLPPLNWSFGSETARASTGAPPPLRPRTVIRGSVRWHYRLCTGVRGQRGVRRVRWYLEKEIWITDDHPISISREREWEESLT